MLIKYETNFISKNVSIALEWKLCFVWRMRARILLSSAWLYDSVYIQLYSHLNVWSNTRSETFHKWYVEYLIVLKFEWLLLPFRFQTCAWEKIKNKIGKIKTFRIQLAIMHVFIHSRMRSIWCTSSFFSPCKCFYCYLWMKEKLLALYKE